MPSPSPTEWIFLRGLARESAHWDDFPALFREKIPGSRVSTVDVPGNGEHWRMRSPATIAEMMEFARQQVSPGGPADNTVEIRRPLPSGEGRVRAEAHDKPAISWYAPRDLALTPTPLPRGEGLISTRLSLAGGAIPRYLLAISMGGMVAVEWLHRHPEEIVGAVLINTSLAGLSPVHRRLSWRCWPAFLSIAFTRRLRARELAILRLTSQRGANRPELLETRVQAYRRHPVGLLNLLRQLRASAAYRPPTDKPAAPVLLINSLGDRMVDPSCTEAIARQWSLPLSTHPWGGHDLPIDDPEWIVGRVLEWVNSSRQG